MARKPGAAAPAPHPVNDKAVAEALDANAERATHLMIVDQQFGNRMSEYHLGQALSGIQFLLGHAGQSCMEAGRLMILVKEHEGHGAFLDALKKINVHPRTAQRLMLVAAKFGKYDTLSHLPHGKLTELSVLNEDQLAELDNGFEVLGITFTDIDRMSRQELADGLEEERAEKQSYKELLEDKNETIDKLTRQNKNLPKLRPWSDECAGLVDEFLALVKKSYPLLGAMHDRVEQIGDLMADRKPSLEEGKTTALQLIHAVDLLVGLLAPLQSKMYGEFQGYVPSTHTTLYAPLVPPTE